MFRLEITVMAKFTEISIQAEFTEINSYRLNVIWDTNVIWDSKCCAGQSFIQFLWGTD